ncbi:MAG: polysaccharide biosynthesis/export family protein [Deltaproteobacteria bacterium]|nr:polysaccharide biosynthesis/export family protein [Deltaproteobacteria bacterium]
MFILCCLASTVSAGNAYKIGPGDILEIIVWNDTQLSRQVVVPPDCMVSYPLAGDINVMGITIAELETEMQERLKAYLPETPVTVSLIAANDLKIYVLGKVNKPGVFPVNLNTDVMQALAMAGGLSPFASDKKILILRKEGGEQNKYIFNYSQVEKGDSLEQNIILKKGDVIVVP